MEPNSAAAGLSPDGIDKSALLLDWSIVIHSPRDPLAPLSLSRPQADKIPRVRPTRRTHPPCKCLTHSDTSRQWIGNSHQNVARFSIFQNRNGPGPEPNLQRVKGAKKYEIKKVVIFFQIYFFRTGNYNHFGFIVTWSMLKYNRSRYTVVRWYFLRPLSMSIPSPTSNWSQFTSQGSVYGLRWKLLLVATSLWPLRKMALQLAHKKDVTDKQ